VTGIATRAFINCDQSCCIPVCSLWARSRNGHSNDAVISLRAIWRNPGSFRAVFPIWTNGAMILRECLFQVAIRIRRTWKHCWSGRICWTIMAQGTISRDFRGTLHTVLATRALKAIVCSSCPRVRHVRTGWTIYRGGGSTRTVFSTYTCHGVLIWKFARSFWTIHSRWTNKDVSHVVSSGSISVTIVTSWANCAICGTEITVCSNRAHCWCVETILSAIVTIRTHNALLVLQLLSESNTYIKILIL